MWKNLDAEPWTREEGEGPGTGRRRGAAGVLCININKSQHSLTYHPASPPAHGFKLPLKSNLSSLPCPSRPALPDQSFALHPYFISLSLPCSPSPIFTGYCSVPPECTKSFPNSQSLSWFTPPDIPFSSSQNGPLMFILRSHQDRWSHPSVGYSWNSANS